MNSYSAFSTDPSRLFEKSRVLKLFLKVFHQFFGSFDNFVGQIEDPRIKRSNNYSLASLIFTGVAIFLTRIKSVRQVKYILNTELSRKTFKTLFKANTIPHGSTLNGVFEELDPDQIQLLPVKMVRMLLRKKTLDSKRGFGLRTGKFAVIAMDGTGVYKFKNRHCKHCLTKKSKKTGEIKYYYHMVLEAKLLTRDGMALSVMSEFIENPHEEPTKQDCETKSFHRLAQKLKKSFPRQPFIIVLDGLFAEGPVFKTCIDNDWKFMIVLKDKDLPSVNQEFRNLIPLHPKNTHTQINGGVTQRFTWCNDIHYRDTQNRDFKLNVLNCQESRKGVEKTFRWISNIPVSIGNVVELARIGRSRWIIENQGFNVQKNLDFELEHSYSEDIFGMKVYYLLLQVAHIWIQLCERSNLLRRFVTEDFGALKNLAFLLLEAWRNFPLDEQEWEALKEIRVQIRLDPD